MENNEERKQENSMLEDQQMKELPKTSIEENAKKLEEGIINPKSLDKKTLAEYAIFYKSRRYPEERIARILCVTKRTVERYIKKIKMENSLQLGENFQKNLLNEVMYYWQESLRRLTHLSYKQGLRPYEECKMIHMCHEVMMDGIALLERLSYLDKQQSMLDITSKNDHAMMIDKIMRDPLMKKSKKLTQEQRNEVAEFIGRECKEGLNAKEFRKEWKKMVDNFSAENKRKENQQKENQSNSDIIDAQTNT